MSAAFLAFVDRKTREAERARITPLRTVEDRTGGQPLRAIGNPWTRRHYDGDCHLFEPPARVPAMSMVFVQSHDGNTAIDNPEDLGGGDVDKHLIYEGLSRVAADGVLAGAATVGPGVFFSVWHPELIALRRDLGLPRHPAQIVLSHDGRVDFTALLFNVPDVPVFLVAGLPCRNRCVDAIASRPWITVVPVDPNRLFDAFERLHGDYGLTRISVVGGRSTASSLVDAGLIQDLHLTTTPKSGGTPGTPFYAGERSLRRDIIVRKRGPTESPLVYEHLAVRTA